MQIQVFNDMSSLKDQLSDKLTELSAAEFRYIETNDIGKASEIDLNCSGIYMEATVIYFEIKHLQHLLKENGRRKVAQTYTMFHQVLAGIAKENNGFVNCFAPNAFLLIFPCTEENFDEVVTTAFKIGHALTNPFKPFFSTVKGLEFAMGIDNGHIMGTKNLSDNNLENLTWFGTTIVKAMEICKYCARPYHVGVSSIIFHNLDESLKVAKRRILGIPKTIEFWVKGSYQFDNTKKHYYQSNHKIPLE